MDYLLTAPLTSMQNAFSVKGKNVVVTGGGSGIGRGIAKAFAESGANVIIFDINLTAAQAVCEELKSFGGRHTCFACNIADHENVKTACAGVFEFFDHVDVLVNNAGVAGQALFQDITDELWHRYFSVNVDGAYHAIQAVLPAMLHHHEGCIINTSSIWGLRGASCEVTYSCTKAALIGLTRSLAAELAPTHIRVNCVAPGVIRTDMLDALPAEILPQLAQETPMGRLGTPEDIAHAVAFLASDKADFITGQVLTCDGGFIL